MIIDPLPISIRKPGVYSSLVFSDDISGLVPLPRRVVVIAGAKGGSAPFALPVQIFSQADADTKLGMGTSAALGAKMAFTTGKTHGATPEVWAVPIQEPGGGVAAVETITVTGPATAAGTLTLRIAGRIVSVGVNNGDSQNTIAASIAAAIQALVATMPVTATVGANVVSCTHTTKGVNGNDVVYELAPGSVLPPGVGIALAQSVAGAGTIDIAAALAALTDQHYHAIATSNHTSTDIAEEIVDIGATWGFNVANTWRFYFMASTGSLGTIQALATAADNFPIHVIGSRGSASLPVEIAVAAATAWMSFDAPNVNMDGDILPLVPPNGANTFDDAELESLLGGGVTPLAPAGSFCSIVRMVTTQTTVSLANSTPIVEVRESAVVRTTAALAEQVAIKIGGGLVRASQTQDVLDEGRDLVVETDRAAERLGWIKNVDDYLDKITTIYDPDAPGRMLASNPHSVVQPLHQVVVVSTSFQAA